MCCNYNELAKAKPVYKKQTIQLINGSDVRIRQQPRPTRTHVNRSSSSTKQVLLDKEYSNLKNMLPTLNNKPKVSKICLINEAVKYISELQEQVIQKLNTDSLIIQQKILEEFEQQLNSSSNTDKPSSRSTSRSKNKNLSNNSRRSPLEELNNQMSVKRQRV